MADDTNHLPLFVYGTLRDPDVRAVALGALSAHVESRDAVLEGHGALCVADGAYAALRTDAGEQAPGELLSCKDAPGEMRAALNTLGDGFGYRLAPRDVMVEGAPVAAMVYLPDDSVIDNGHPWRLEDWASTHKPVFLEAAKEVTTLGLASDARAGVLRRAAQRVAASVPSPAGKLRSDFGPGAIMDHQVSRAFTGFFAMEVHTLRHRTFDGGTSGAMRREVFVAGDAVSVLPWDPVTDRVLLIEQFRAGILGRGEANPWNVEVIAGLVDGVEAPEETARREAEEEAGLSLGRLHKIAGYYPSPGAMTEHVTSFIGEADLANAVDGLHGLDSEHEDIRTLVVPRAEAMATVRSGEARNAPLLLSLMALDALQGQLVCDWLGGVAVPPAPG